MPRYKLRTPLIVLSIGPTVLAALSCVQRDANTSAVVSKVVYASPTEVWNAYSDARSKGDLRKCFECLTPDAQADAVFETYFACGMRDSDEVAAICEKYIGETNTFQTEYERRYKEEHAMSIEDVLAKERIEPPRDQTATSDRELLVEVLNAHIKDRAGFYEAANNLIEQLGRDPADQNNQRPKQDLRDVLVTGEKATGVIYVFVVSYQSAGGEPPQRQESKFPKTINFRKIGDGWLIDMN